MTSEVARLYEMFPFPRPEASRPPIFLVAREMSFLLVDNRLDGWRVLDAGCGTGHIVVGFAKQYPDAHFIGVDASQRSIDTARRLAENYGVSNVEFIHGNIPDLSFSEKFDLITCLGVLHHLPDPRVGLLWLSEHLAASGLLYLWLYNALGEHGRMLDRELVQLFTSIEEGESALEILRALGITLPLDQYGWTGSENSVTEQDVIDADAYLNPIVQPMRFTDVPILFKDVEFEWVAADRIYFKGGKTFIDLGGVESDRTLFLAEEYLFSGLRLC